MSVATIHDILARFREEELHNRHFPINADERFLPVYEYTDEENRKITRLDAFAAELASMKKAA